jgi:hypothetical protein
MYYETINEAETETSMKLHSDEEDSYENDENDHGDSECPLGCCDYYFYFIYDC